MERVGVFKNKTKEILLVSPSPLPTPVTPDAYSDLFTIATQSQTRSLVCTWPRVQLRDYTALHAIHQAPPETEHHTTKPIGRAKPTNVQSVACPQSLPT